MYTNLTERLNHSPLLPSQSLTTFFFLFSTECHIEQRKEEKTNEKKKDQRNYASSPRTDFEEFWSHPPKNRCFNDCISDFTSKSLGSKEETCINRCVAKFLNSTDRVGARFAELYVDPYLTEIMETCTRNKKKKS